MPFTILLVGDHGIMRAGIKALVERNTEFQVVAEAETGLEAMRLCKRVHPDIVVMHAGVAGSNGIDAAKELLRGEPSATVIVLATYDDDDSVVNAIRSGARAFLFRHASPADFMDALRTVAQGGSYLDPHVSNRLLTGIQRGALNAQGRSQRLEKLTARERQVLSLILEGNKSKEIAGVLNLGAETVYTYRKALMKKLGVSNVAGLFKAALPAETTPHRKERSQDLADRQSRISRLAPSSRS